MNQQIADIDILAAHMRVGLLISMELKTMTVGERQSLLKQLTSMENQLKFFPDGVRARRARRPLLRRSAGQEFRPVLQRQSSKV